MPLKHTKPQTHSRGLTEDEKEHLRQILRKKYDAELNNKEKEAIVKINHAKKEALISTLNKHLKEAFEELCPSEADREQFVQRIFEGTGYSPSLSRKTPASPAHVLPVQAPALWLEREDRAESVPDFIRRVYAPWLGQGLTQAHVSHLDRSLYNALQKWLGKEGNSLEAVGVDLPSKKQMNDRQLAATFGGAAVSGAVVTQALREASPESRERMRLYHVAQRREARRRLG